jgi:hypothetical protein
MFACRVSSAGRGRYKWSRTTFKLLMRQVPRPLGYSDGSQSIFTALREQPILLVG